MRQRARRRALGAEPPRMLDRGGPVQERRAPHLPQHGLSAEHRLGHMARELEGSGAVLRYEQHHLAPDRGDQPLHQGRGLVGAARAERLGRSFHGPLVQRDQPLHLQGSRQPGALGVLEPAGRQGRQRQRRFDRAQRALVVGRRRDQSFLAQLRDDAAEPLLRRVEHGGQVGRTPSSATQHHAIDEFGPAVESDRTLSFVHLRAPVKSWIRRSVKASAVNGE
ncbi:hypothetical protein NEH83_20010 [Streptomyces sp. JUS-F4]|uniref:hypothetical protein n=1 Tax=Streptomyces sp. JUS-F4 TaxID=2951988 RepID=UPI0026671639|nr:hypothetical protein [Streptomyces sp. JUS-F4]WKN16258.1 hypothetical protein NEH83_20010 [Streptomyces sp. JUS-F4]